MRTTVVLCCCLLSLLMLLSTGNASTSTVVRSMDQLLTRMNSGNGPTKCKDFFEEHCPIGCNGRIGENALFEDECGVCGGDGSTCDNNDDDGGCDSTCIALVIGIPLGVLALLALLALIIFFASAGNRRRRRQRRRRSGTTLTILTNEQYRPSQSVAATNSTYYHHHHQGRRRKNPVGGGGASAIRWTNGAPRGWGKGEKYY